MKFRPIGPHLPGRAPGWRPLRGLKYCLKRLWRGLKTVITFLCLIALLWIIVYGCAYAVGLGFTEGVATAIKVIIADIMPIGGLPV